MPRRIRSLGGHRLHRVVEWEGIARRHAQHDDAGLIRTIYIVRNPDKLTKLPV